MRRRFVSSLFTVCFLCGVIASQSLAKDRFAAAVAKPGPAGSRDEPFLDRLSLPAAAQFLDEGAHLVEQNCFACHSTFTHMAARSILDPLAQEVMKSRILIERFNALLFDPAQSGKIKTHHIPRVRVVSAVELARHDAATTGVLAPATRKALDHMWSYQKTDGGIDWLKVGEAPQAIDDYWPAAMMALGAGIAPGGYARTEKAKAGIEKLRGWFKAHPPQTLHERGLVLVAHSFIGGTLGGPELAAHADAIFARQHADGGWSMADLAPWKRKDAKPLDPLLTDGYATGFLLFALARGGMTAGDPRMQRGLGWIQTHQRQGGGWFTQSPFRRDRIATNTGTSLIIQALEACGEIRRPSVTVDQFAAARAAADRALPPGEFLPGQDHPPLTASPGSP